MNNDRIPYLIQRVTRRSHVNEGGKGFNRIFSLDYMGSSEFEWGAIPKALKEMRAMEDTWKKVRKITIGKHTAYYVGSPDMFNAAIQLFEDELKPTYSERKFRHKEGTYLYESYNPVKGKNYNLFDAWWAIDSEPPFFLFKDVKHAQEFLDIL